MDHAVRQFLFLIDTAYDHVSWHGTNLRGSLRGLTPEQAAWRPSPGRHNIWELVVHAAYWKYVVWRRLTGAPRGSFTQEGSNWFERPTDVSTKAWQADLRALADAHRTLRAAIADLDPQTLDRPLGGGSRTTPRSLVTGVAAHDFYHAGQIQLLKRLQGRS